MLVVLVAIAVAGPRVVLGRQRRGRRIGLLRGLRDRGSRHAGRRRCRCVRRRRRDRVGRARSGGRRRCGRSGRRRSWRRCGRSGAGGAGVGGAGVGGAGVGGAGVGAGAGFGLRLRLRLRVPASAWGRGDVDDRDRLGLLDRRCRRRRLRGGRRSNDHDPDGPRDAVRLQRRWRARTRDDLRGFDDLPPARRRQAVGPDLAIDAGDRNADGTGSRVENARDGTGRALIERLHP